MKLMQYANIEKISEFANRIIKNGIDYGLKSPLKFYMEEKHIKWIFQKIIL